MAKTNLPPQPAGTFDHVEQKAIVSCSVDGQQLQPVMPERKDGESNAEYVERRDAFLAVYNDEPDMRCTVTRVIEWPNGRVQREIKQISARCKYAEVREYQKDSEAAAKAAGF